MHGNASAFPQQDFHLSQNGNHHFTLCLQGCGRFSYPKNWGTSKRCTGVYPFFGEVRLAGEKNAATARRFSVEYRLAIQTRQGGCRAVNDAKIAFSTTSPDSASALIHAGAAHFHTQKMGKLQAALSSRFAAHLARSRKRAGSAFY